MIKLDYEEMEQEAKDDVASVFKLGGGVDINTIPGHYPNEDYELAMSILTYRDSIYGLTSNLDANVIEERVKNATAAMLDVTKAIEKLKVAKQLDGIQTLEPHEIAYLNIAAGLNQIFKSFIERIENHGRSEHECSHEE